MCGKMRGKKEKGKDLKGRNSLLSNGAVKKTVPNVTKCQQPVNLRKSSQTGNFSK